MVAVDVGIRVSAVDSAVATSAQRSNMRIVHRVLCLLVAVAGMVLVRPGLAHTASGPWSTVASMPTARWGLAAAAGSDGRIYAIGGGNLSGLLSTVEAYSPSTNSWSSVAPMPTARTGLAAVTGSDGRIYAIGGSDGSHPLRTVEAYDPSTNTWSTVAPMPTARSVAAATGRDGRIYAIGGYNPINPHSGLAEVFNAVEAYDPRTNTWSTVAPMPTARAGLAAATGPDGRIYAIGGCAYDHGACRSLKTVEAYDPATNTWSTVASLPTPRDSLAAVTGPDGRIYATGGCRDCGVTNQPPTNTVEVYDPAMNTWSRVASLSTARFGLTAATGSDGRIYAIGGYDDFEGVFNTVEVATPPLPSYPWSTVAPMPTARIALAAATGPDGRIYAIGGFNGVALNTVEAYRPRTNTWSTVASMPTARIALAAATGPDGRIYAIGGWNQPGADNSLSTVEAYTPATNSWSTVAPMPTARDGLAAATGPDGRIYAIGGTDGMRSLNMVEAYTPATNTWSTVASMPTARCCLAAATGTDGRIYAIGGWNQPGGDNTLSTVEAYDPSTNTWSTLAPMPTARGDLAAATGPDDRIYAIGGRDGGRNSLSTVEAYTPATNTWSTVAPMLFAGWGLAAATGPDGRIYAMGGDVEAYTPLVPATAAPATATPTATPSATPTVSPTAMPSPMPTPRAMVLPAVTHVSGGAGAVTASFTVRFSSQRAGQGEVYFGSGPDCLGLVEVATQDLHPGTAQHEVVVTGNDLSGTVGNNGILPGTTYWFETVTVTPSGMEVDNNNGQCYNVVIPT
jgi:N-acetylneuraminic acid mutarotase